MERSRRGVLIALGAVAVLAFLVAPSDGLFARVPLMVLCAVLAVIWHLLVTGPRSSGTSDGATLRAAALDGDGTAVGAPEHRAGYFELEPDQPVAPTSTEPGAVPATAAGPAPVDAAAAADLSDLPDPPANWPGVGVEVPRVFQLHHDEEHGLEELIDLTDPEPVREPVQEVLFEPPPAPEPVLQPAGGTGEDPWLAFAASMFGDR